MSLRSLYPMCLLGLKNYHVQVTVISYTATFLMNLVMIIMGTSALGFNIYGNSGASNPLPPVILG